MGLSINHLIRRLRRATLESLSDRELLEALVSRRDEAAFETLLRRHGPMVLAVCRRVLRHAHDAEDAFQATFLTLLRRATSVRKREALGSWLYGVAYRTALKARGMKARRRIKERQVALRTRQMEAEPNRDLDDELSALPEMYRVPVVLCELEGRSRQEVARHLGIPEGTLSSRLAAARKMLAQRLSRHGWTFADVKLASVALPALLLGSTVQAASLVLAGRAAAEVFSAKVIALTEGTVNAMFVNKLRALTVALVLVGVLGLGTGQLAFWSVTGGPTATAEEPPKPPPDELPLAEIDLAKAAADLKQAEALLAGAKAQLAQKEAAYREALNRKIRSGAKELPAALAAALTGQLKYRIPIEIGLTETSNGGRIDIVEVWGTRPKIEVGGAYLVHGKYVLPSKEDGKVYFYRTATEGSGSGPVLDLQTTIVAKGQGDFTLVHHMEGRGYFHLLLEAPEGRFANVYFGTDDNILRKW
jgi:RNA polymerase sigma factor (sigma-70 family)